MLKRLDSLVRRLVLGRNHRLFDVEYYLRHAPGPGRHRLCPFLRYLMGSWREGRDPHPFFDTRFFLERHGHLRVWGEPPLALYLRRRRDAPHVSPRLDMTALDPALAEELARTGITPLAWYLEHPADPRFQPFPLFDADYYAKTNPTAARNSPVLLKHFFLHGAGEGARPNALFDPDFYRRTYLPEGATSLDAFLHYVDEGRHRDLRPNPLFDPAFYRDQLPEDERAGLGEPLVHYLKRGLLLGLYPGPEVASLAAAEKTRISILVPVYNTDANLLWRCVHSVLTQPWPHWELCLADDGSTAPHIAPMLAEFAALDRRIKVAAMPEGGKNTGIAAASNRAAALATGDWLAFLDHDDELAPEAIFHVVRAIQTERPDALYSDERLVNLESRHLDAIYKCALNRELLRSHNHLMHFFVVRRTLFEELGGLDGSCDGAQDYDLSLKVAEKTGRIRHIPQLLYHWRAHDASSSIRHEDKPYADEAGRRALAASLTREGIDAKAETTDLHFFYRARRRLPERGLLTVCADGSATAWREGIAASWRDIEWLAAPTEGTPPHPARNAAARQATGDWLFFVGAEVHTLRANSLPALLEYAQSPDIGMAAGRLERPESPHVHRGSLPDLANASPLYWASFVQGVSVEHNRFHCAQYAWALAGELCLIRRALFLEIGGYDPAFRTLAFAQLDLCFRLCDRGLHLVYTPWAAGDMACAEPSEAELAAAEADRALFQERRQSLLAQGDPWYNRALLAEAGIGATAFAAWMTGNRPQAHHFFSGGRGGENPVSRYR